MNLIQCVNIAEGLKDFLASGRGFESFPRKLKDLDERILVVEKVFGVKGWKPSNNDSNSPALWGLHKEVGSGLVAAVGIVKKLSSEVGKGAKGADISSMKEELSEFIVVLGATEEKIDRILELMGLSG